MTTIPPTMPAHSPRTSSHQNPMPVDCEVTGNYVSLEGERYFRIANSHRMEDFFMSLVGADDHWMFVSSNGALTAGRRNADNALFPYASDDKISAARAETGSFTLLRVGDHLWEPFAPHPAATDTIRHWHQDHRAQR